MKRHFREVIIAGIIVLTVIQRPASVCWWNLIYPVKSESVVVKKQGEDKQVRFFIVDWVKNITIKGDDN